MSRERKFLSVFFPNWSIDVARRARKKQIKRESCTLEGSEVNRPLALVTAVAGQLIVTRACPQVLGKGVTLGMPLPLAKALEPRLESEQFLPTRDYRILTKLAEWCFSFTPLVGLDYELHKSAQEHTLLSLSHLWYGLVLDLTGTEKLHGDLLAFSNRIASLFSSDARFALTPTIGASWALSRCTGKGAVAYIPSLKDIPPHMQSLPVESLRISCETKERLHEVGIFWIKDLLAIPTHTLAQRFGKFLLYRLEQCLGRIDERALTIVPSKDFTIAKSFETPLTNRRSIVLTIKHLFSQLLHSLHSHGKRSAAFSIIMKDCNGTIQRKDFSLASATSVHNDLLTIVTPIIERVNFFGELRTVELVAKEISDASSSQNSLLRKEKGIDLLNEKKKLLNNFSIKLGKDKIAFASIRPSHIPERSFAHTPLEQISDERSSGTGEIIPSYSLYERPTKIYSLPEKISTLAMLPDRPPSSVVWRGKKYKIISGVGPERIAPEWWRENLVYQTASERDYFKVQDELGRWLWVYRDCKSLEWFLHGAWV